MKKFVFAMLLGLAFTSCETKKTTEEATVTEEVTKEATTVNDTISDLAVEAVDSVL